MPHNEPDNNNNIFKKRECVTSLALFYVICLASRKTWGPVIFSFLSGSRDGGGRLNIQNPVGFFLSWKEMKQVREKQEARK